MRADAPYAKPGPGHSWARFVPEELVDQLEGAKQALADAEAAIIKHLADTGQEPVPGFEGEPNK
jgi:hypothetical protein